jgi:hypothetical protein
MTLYGRIMVNNELEEMWKVVVSLLYGTFSGESEGIHKKKTLMRTAGVLSEN